MQILSGFMFQNLLQHFVESQDMVIHAPCASQQTSWFDRFAKSLFRSLSVKSKTAQKGRLWGPPP